MKRIIIVIFLVCIYISSAQASDKYSTYTPSKADINRAKSVIKTFQQSVFNGCVKRAKAMGHYGKEAENRCLCAAMIATQCVDMNVLLQSGDIKIDNKKYIQQVEKECAK